MHDTTLSIYNEMLDTSDLADQFCTPSTSTPQKSNNLCDVDSANTCSKEPVQVATKPKNGTDKVTSVCDSLDLAETSESNRFEHATSKQASTDSTSGRDSNPGAHLDTTLTATWNLCRETDENESSLYDRVSQPPPEILQFFEAMVNSDVQEYIKNFLKLHGRNQAMQGDHNKIYLRNEIQETSSRMSREMAYSHEKSYSRFTQDTNTHFPTSQALQHPSSFTQDCNTYAMPSQTHMPSFQPQQHQPLVMHTFPQGSNMYNMPPHAQMLSQQPLQQTSHTQQSTWYSEPTQTHSSQFSQSESTPHAYKCTQYDHDDSYDMPEDDRDSPSPSLLSTPLRRSPRKTKENDGSSDRVRLLSTSHLTIGSQELRKATTAADKAVPTRAAFKLTLKLLPHFFSMETLAKSRGQGLRNSKKPDPRPILDPKITAPLKKYVQPSMMQYLRSPAMPER